MLKKSSPTNTAPPLKIPSATRAAIRRALRGWYASHQRELPWRKTSDPYCIWVSEVMLQQTQVNTAAPYYLRFIDRFPDVHSLAVSDRQTVLKYWEGLGYYSRARNLHKAAALIANNLQGRFPESWESVRQLPGIGDYIAAAVLSIAFGQAHAVVDGNVKRVVSRLFRVPLPINRSSAHPCFQDLANQLLDRMHPGDHNQSVMELGALVCTPRKPDCRGCVLSKYCGAFKSDSVGSFPRRMKRAPLPERHLAVGAVKKHGRILLVQRAENGLLGGLWEFPGGAVKSDDDPGSVCKESIKTLLNLEVALEDRMFTVRHAYTHFKLRMDVYPCRWQTGRVRLNGPANFKWVAPSRIGELPLHGAMHKALKGLFDA